MKGIISFEQELRATRLANEKKKGTRSNSAPEPKESERPWQEDIEQVQQTMREVLRAVADFSGVELPGLPSGVQDNSAPAPTLDIKTLKDRFRNELEGFSIKTSKELANRAREQTLAALEAVQNEVGGQLEQVAAGLREQLQLPAQVEKLLQPCLEDSAARLEKSFSQKLTHLVSEQDQLVQDRLQSALNSVQARMAALEQDLHQTREVKADSAGQTSAELNSKISALEQQIHHIRELKADSAATLSAELNSRVENLFAEQQRSMQEGLRNALTAVQAQMSAQLTAALQEQLQAPAPIEKLIEPCVGQATARLEESFVPKVELLINEQDQSVKERLEGALSSVQAQMSALEQSVQQIRELKTDSSAQTSAELNAKFEHLLAKNEQLIQDRLQIALRSVQAQMSEQLAAQFREQLQAPAQIEKLLEPCFKQAAARLEESFVPKVELLINEQDQAVQDRLQTALSSFYAKMNSLEQNVQRVGELKAGSVTQAPAEQQNAALENSISQKVERLLASQERSVQGRLQGALSSVQGQLSALEQNLQEIRELKADSVDQASAEQQNAALETSLSQKIERLFAEQERLIQGRLQTALSSIQAQMSALEQNLTEVREIKADAAPQPAAEQQNEALENAIFQKVERLFAKQDRLIQGRVKTALNSIQTQMDAVEQKMELMRELKAALVAQMSAHQPSATVDHAMKKAEARLNNGFKEFLDRSFSRIEGSFNSLMETPKFKPVQSTHAKLEALRKSIPDGSTEMLIRVQQALDNLDRLGSKDPLPVS